MKRSQFQRQKFGRKHAQNFIIPKILQNLPYFRKIKEVVWEKNYAACGGAILVNSGLRRQ